MIPRELRLPSSFIHIYTHNKIKIKHRLILKDYYLGVSLPQLHEVKSRNFKSHQVLVQFIFIENNYVNVLV